MSAIEQKERIDWGRQSASIIVLAGWAYVLVRAGIEFYNVAWGTGHWLGEFSLKWAIGFAGFVLFCLFSWLAAALALWKPAVFGRLPERIIAFRERIGPLRWLVVLALLLLPVWFMQYSPWGIVFWWPYVRWVIWIYAALGLAVFFRSGVRLGSWTTLLVAVLLTTSTYSIAVAFIDVSDYPFSRGWSEGNRMWDYSMLFGRHLYDPPPGRDVYVLIDIGRQFIGGLPFLIPGLTIQAERFWIALTVILPYLLLGLAAFRADARNRTTWLLLALWAFIFLKQGPIHPPLVMCAFATALAWRSRLWVGLPLIFLTGYFAEESRYTWLFAPGIWIVMLELGSAALQEGRLRKSAWLRGAALGGAGAVGGYFGPSLLRWLTAAWEHLRSAPVSAVVETPYPPPVSVAPSVSVALVTSEASSQPLLWYRLFPNATHDTGIVISLLVAIAPLAALLFYLSLTKKWVLNTWQKLTLALPLVAFLVVGLIVSAKIGGGGDLHNLDMFLIGLFFSAVIAWENGGRDWFRGVDAAPLWVKGALVLLVALPGRYPISALRGYHFAEQAPWLATLTDVGDAKYLEMLPAEAEVEEALQAIRREVDAAKSRGEVLFIDQRQLLTFGYVRDVPFVPEYEKKILMNEALSAEAGYFQQFYADLEARRFALIVTEPLKSPIRDSDFQFGEENNAWAAWVVDPLLCYYQPIATFKNVQVQLLVPWHEEVDCSSVLPITVEAAP
ncbi:MAG: hypothetical protein ACOYYU_08645 [Chloroflexota bacterium]